MVPTFPAVLASTTATAGLLRFPPPSLICGRVVHLDVRVPDALLDLAQVDARLLVLGQVDVHRLDVVEVGFGQALGFGLHVVGTVVPLGGAVARCEPLVEGVLQGVGAAVLVAAVLEEPVVELRLVVVADQHLRVGFAVHRRRRVVVAVAQVAGVAGLVGQHREAAEALAGVLAHLLERPVVAALVEHLVLVEAPPTEADAHLRHCRVLAAPPHKSPEAGAAGTASPMHARARGGCMRTVDAAGLPIGDDHPPRVMGVLNVSKESPYDPSVFDDPADAAAYVDEELIGEGADIVDVGLESANKRFEVLSAEQELDRLETAVETIDSVEGDAVFSIETRYSEVADEALSRGFDMVNDICGFADPEMPAVCEAHDVAVAKMASPPDLERPGAVESVDDIYDALALNGFTDKTIVDPAFGGWSEAKTTADDRETFERLREFRGHGYPILVSINRKNFLRELADRSTEDALPVSLAATSMAVERGAHVVRTHDVAETRDAAFVGQAFARDRTRTADVEELEATTVREAERHVDRLGGDADAATDATARAYEVRGLGPAERAELAEFGVAVTGEDPAFVAGTVDRLRDASSALAGRDGALGELGATWETVGN